MDAVLCESTDQMSDKKKNIAVVIPFFNEMDKLSRCVNSLITQTTLPSLVILVDDCGSEPLPASISHSLTELGISVSLLKNQVNIGPGGSRQAGMDALPAHTNYVMFLDSDDYLSDNCLEVLLQAHLGTPGLVATYSCSLNIHTGQSRLRENWRPFDNIMDSILTGHRIWGTGSLLWDFHQIRTVKWPSFRSIEDSHFELSVAMINPRILYVPEAKIYIDQTWDYERLSKRNRLVQEPEIVLRRELYERILKSFPLRSEEAIRKNYLSLAAFHWIKRAPEHTISNLKVSFQYLLTGQWRITGYLLYFLFKRKLGRLS